MVAKYYPGFFIGGKQLGPATALGEGKNKVIVQTQPVINTAFVEAHAAQHNLPVTGVQVSGKPYTEKTAGQIVTAVRQQSGNNAPIETLGTAARQSYAMQSQEYKARNFSQQVIRIEQSASAHKPIWPGSNAAQGESSTAFKPIQNNGKVKGYEDRIAQQSIYAEELPFRQRAYDESAPRFIPEKPSIFSKIDNKWKEWNQKIARSTTYHLLPFDALEKEGAKYDPTASLRQKYEPSFLKNWRQGAYEGVREKPLTAAGNVALMAGIPVTVSGSKYLMVRYAPGAMKFVLGSAAETVPYVSAFKSIAGPTLKYGIGAVYGVVTYRNVAQSPNKARYLGQISSTEIAPFIAGGYIGTKIAAPIEYRTGLEMQIQKLPTARQAEFRSLYSRISKAQFKTEPSKLQIQTVEALRNKPALAREYTSYLSQNKDIIVGGSLAPRSQVNKSILSSMRKPQDIDIYVAENKTAKIKYDLASIARKQGYKVSTLGKDIRINNVHTFGVKTYGRFEGMVQESSGIKAIFPKTYATTQTPEGITIMKIGEQGKRKLIGAYLQRPQESKDIKDFYNILRASNTEYKRSTSTKIIKSPRKDFLESMEKKTKLLSTEQPKSLGKPSTETKAPKPPAEYKYPSYTQYSGYAKLGIPTSGYPANNYPQTTHLAPYKAPPMPQRSPYPAATPRPMTTPKTAYPAQSISSPATLGSPYNNEKATPTTSPKMGAGYPANSLKRTSTLMVPEAGSFFRRRPKSTNPKIKIGFTPPKQRKQYTPDVASLAQEYRGPKNKRAEMAGIGIRPIPTRLRKRKR